MRMKIVQFGNGMFGIRKGILYKKYLDMKHPKFWWPRGREEFPDCMTNDIDLVRKMYDIHVAREYVIDFKKEYLIKQLKD